MKLLRILFILAIIAIIGLYFVWQKAPDIIASQLSSEMKVDVKINKIDVSQNDIIVSKVSIGNPEGSKLPTAFSCDTIKVETPVTNYTSDPIVIDLIALDNIYLSLESSSPTSMAANWTTIMDNMKKSSPPAPKDESKPEAKGTSVLIKKLVLTNINAEIVYPLQMGKSTKLDPIDRIELTNISSESGVPLDQVIAIVLQQTLQTVLKKNAFENVLNPTSVLPKGVSDMIPFMK
ncbi:MAG: hypothetical protein LLF94_01945 [Chlamydiales bacterium]|nr:hypothetical protein [Chlamydiales bacterium]